MSIDPIGNFLTIIRNGVMISKTKVSAPYSKIKHEIASILLEEGFVKNIAISGDGISKRIEIKLNYTDGESAIHEIKRVSSPGRRSYAGKESIKPVIGGLGLSILSTSKGVLSDKKAKQLGVGGEILCTVW